MQPYAPGTPAWPGHPTGQSPRRVVRESRPCDSLCRPGTPSDARSRGVRKGLMTFFVFIVVLLSATLHAGWNVAAKRAAGNMGALWLGLCLAAVLSWPWAL